MKVHITGYREGFGPVPRFDDVADNIGIAFGALKLAAAQKRELTTNSETAFPQPKEFEL